MKRVLAVVGIVVLAVVVAGIAYWRWSGQGGVPPAPQASTAPPAAQAPGATAAPAPSFDVVRVDPQGGAVIAGRAAPGAEVTVHDGDKVLGKVTADQNGEWVFLPQEPLAPGQHQLSLTARNKDGSESSSQGVVAMVVPEHPPGAQPAPESGAVAVLVPRRGGGAAKALQLPRGRKLALDVIEYDAAGKVQLLGRAPPGARITAAIDDRQAGGGTTANTGEWTVTLDGNVPEGKHQLRLDAFDAKGAKLAELALAFTRVVPPEGAMAVDILPGNNLWRIAQHSYGEGLRYMEIFQANRAQIHNPNLIYPGQVFAVPNNAADKAGKKN